MLVGAAAGVAAGMLGVGGGLIIVPVLVMIFTLHGVTHEVLMHLAVGTSLATIVLTSLSSIRAHHKRGAVLWPIFRQMLPGIILGTLIGSAIARLMPSSLMRGVFGVFELAVAVQLLFGMRAHGLRELPGRIGLTLAGSVVGCISALLGIGGGTLTVPFLNWCRITMKNAVATSSACGLPIALAGMFGFMLSGWGETGLPAWSTGYVNWIAFIGIVPTSMLLAPLGARLAHRLPEVVLRRSFALLLSVLAIKMLWPI